MPAIKDIEPNTYAFYTWSTLDQRYRKRAGTWNRCCDGCANRHLTFPVHWENRLYARSDSPVTRVMFNHGDTITSHEGWQLHIDEVKEENGLLVYVGTRTDTEETNVTLREVLLDSKLVFSKPGIVCSPVKSIEWIGSRCAIAPVNFRASSTGCHTAACAASGPT